MSDTFTNASTKHFEIHECKMDKKVSGLLDCTMHLLNYIEYSNNLYDAWPEICVFIFITITYLITVHLPGTKNWEDREEREEQTVTTTEATAHRLEMHSTESDASRKLNKGGEKNHNVHDMQYNGAC